MSVVFVQMGVVMGGIVIVMTVAGAVMEWLAGVDKNNEGDEFAAG